MVAGAGACCRRWRPGWGGRARVRGRSGGGGGGGGVLWGRGGRVGVPGGGWGEVRMGRLFGLLALARRVLGQGGGRLSLVDVGWLWRVIQRVTYMTAEEVAEVSGIGVRDAAGLRDM